MKNTQALRSRIGNRYLPNSRDAMDDAPVGFLLSFIHALDARDPGSAGNLLLNAQQAVATARVLGLPDAEIDAVRLGALCCNIGMISMPDDLVRQARPLSPDEQMLMQQHPLRGAKLLATIPALGPVLPLILHHHENWSGDGYPSGLHGEDIPLGARIIRVVDTYRALVNARPYRPAYSPEEALRLLKNGAGSQFDPQVVDAFVAQLQGPAIIDAYLARWTDPAREAQVWQVVQEAKVRPRAARAS